MTSPSHLASGRAALAEGRWQDAVAAFEASLAASESAEALDGLADAHWWLCAAHESARVRERAFVAFRRSGDAAAAAMAAVNLSICYLLNLGNVAAARGWLKRAESATVGLEPNPARGWLVLMRGFISRDDGERLDSFRRALEHARVTGDIDLELTALSDLGLALVSAGRVGEGMPLLDEAMAGTMAGEYQRLETVVYASCNMLSSCSLVGDLERATQWCRVADDFMSEYGSPFMFARCRTHFGTVLLAKGQWLRAEDELRAALDMAADAGPGPRDEALARLAELRVLQGRLEEAEAMLATFQNPARAAVPAAALHLARGEPAVAVAVLERRLQAVGTDHVLAGPFIAMLVESHLADGDLGAATAAAEQLDAVLASQDRDHIRALVAFCAARLAVARREPEAAVGHYEAALELFAALDLPFELASARAELAAVLSGIQQDIAVAEAKRALAAFDELGAVPAADETASLLRSLGGGGRTGPKDVGVLTKRETQVLRLLGLGLSNPEIAERLFISRKTAAHHVSSVLTKLGLRNRAEAAAYAARELDPD